MSSTTARTGGRPVHTKRSYPGQRRLAWASLMVIIGSFLPWVSTALGNVSGARGAGLWTFYAAMLGLAGAIIPFRRLAIGQGTVMAAAALLLPAWQVVHLVTKVRFEGWLPGPGLVLTFGGGLLAAFAVRQLLRPVPDAPAPPG